MTKDYEEFCVFVKESDAVGLNNMKHLLQIGLYVRNLRNFQISYKNIETGLTRGKHVLSINHTIINSQVSQV